MQLASLVGVVLVFTGMLVFWRLTRGAHDPAPAKVLARLPAKPVLNTQNLPIRSGDTLADLLQGAGIDQDTRAEMIDAVKKTFDLRKLRAGSLLKLTRFESGAPEGLEYIIDLDHELKLSQAGPGFSAAVVGIPCVTHVVRLCATLDGSLFESIERTGANAELALRVAEIFAWDIDFYSDPQQGDEFCLVLEKKVYSNGQPATYGRILAAKYKNAGTLYDAFLFPDEDGKPRYYSHDGRSLQAAFLRSPMKFDARVSSHFSRRRFHPVLRIYRPHLGTDYAAPTGTPVQAVASGRVTFSGRQRGAGNLIRIQHAGGYETYYMHLSRRFVRRGQRVEQGQRIGLVGATGLATGSHLDFRVRKNGRFVNFERLRLPRATRIGSQQADAFAERRARYENLMQGDSPSVVAAASSAAPESNP